MSMVNFVSLIGNLGRDPEIRYTPQGTPVANVSLATNESYKDKNTGEKKELTEWHRLVFFGKTAEIIKEHAKEGTGLAVQGRLRTRKWEDKEGKDRYTTEIVVDEFRFLSKPGKGEEAKGLPAGKAEDIAGEEVPF